MSKIIPLTTEIAIRQHTRKLVLESIKRILKEEEDTGGEEIILSDDDVEEIASKTEQVFEIVDNHGLDYFISNYLIVAREAMRPLLDKVNWCLTFPVYDHAFLELYGLIYALISQDKSDLRYTRAFMSVFGEEDENMSEFLGSFINPTDPLNWGGIIALLAAIPTGGGSVAAWVALKTAMQQGGRQGLKRFIKKATQNVAAKEIGKEALPILGKEISEKTITKAAKDQGLDASKVRLILKAVRKTLISKPGQQFTKINDSINQVIKSNEDAIKEILERGGSLREIRELLLIPQNFGALYDNIIVDISDDIAKACSDQDITKDIIEDILTSSSSFKKAAEDLIKTGLESSVDGLVLKDSFFRSAIKMIPGGQLSSELVEKLFSWVFKGRGFDEAAEEVIEELGDEAFIKYLIETGGEATKDLLENALGDLSFAQQQKLLLKITNSSGSGRLISLLEQAGNPGQYKTIITSVLEELDDKTLTQLATLYETNKPLFTQFYNVTMAQRQNITRASDFIMNNLGDQIKRSAAAGVIRKRVKLFLTYFAFVNVGDGMVTDAADNGVFDSDIEKIMKSNIGKNAQFQNSPEVEARKEAAEKSKSKFGEEISKAFVEDDDFEPGTVDREDAEELGRAAKLKEDDLGMLYKIFDSYDDLLKIGTHFGDEVTRLARYWNDPNWQLEFAGDVDKVDFDAIPLLGFGTTGLRELENVFGKKYVGFGYTADLENLVSHLGDKGTGVLYKIATNKSYGRSEALNDLKNPPLGNIPKNDFKSILNDALNQNEIKAIDKVSMGKAYSYMIDVSKSQKSSLDEKIKLSNLKLRKIIRKNILLEIKKKRFNLLNEAVDDEKANKLNSKVFSIFNDLNIDPVGLDAQFEYLLTEDEFEDSLKNFLKINKDAKLNGVWNGLENVKYKDTGLGAAGKRDFLSPDQAGDSKTKTSKVVLTLLKLDPKKVGKDLSIKSFEYDSSLKEEINFSDILENADSPFSVYPPSTPDNTLPHRGGFVKAKNKNGKDIIKFKPGEFSKAAKNFYEDSSADGPEGSFGKFISNQDNIFTKFKDQFKTKFNDLAKKINNNKNILIPAAYFISSKTEDFEFKKRDALDFENSIEIKDIEIIPTPILFDLTNKTVAGKFAKDNFGIKNGLNIMSSILISSDYKADSSSKLIDGGDITILKAHNLNVIKSLTEDEANNIENADVEAVEPKVTSKTKKAAKKALETAQEKRKKQKTWVQNMDSSPQSANIVDLKPSGDSRTNIFVYEMSLAFYLYKHGLEESIKSVAPTFYEGMWTSGYGKDYKVNLTLGDVPSGEYQAIEEKVIKHALGEKVGAFNDEAVRKATEGQISNYRWRDFSPLIVNVDPAKYSGYDVNNEPGQVYSAALFFKDLVNNTNPPSGKGSGKSKKSSRSKGSGGKGRKIKSGERNLARQNAGSGSSGSSGNSGQYSRIVIQGETNANLYNAISKKELESIFTKHAPSGAVYNKNSTAQITINFDRDGKFKDLKRISTKHSIGEVISTSDTGAFNSKVDHWIMTIKNELKSKKISDESLSNAKVIVTFKNSSTLNRKTMKESLTRKKVRISKAFKR